MTIKQLIACLDDYRICAGESDFEVKGISCDSRGLSQGYVFVAVKGTRVDGHNFINEAIAKGAQAVCLQDPSCMLPADLRGISFIQVPDTRRALAQLSSHFYHHPSKDIKVIGITGTNGKTTVSYLLEALLKEAGANPAVIGTINYRFQDKVFPAQNTTPGPIELQSMLAQMLNEGSGYAIVEVSSHALNQERTKGIIFHSAIFTNLTQDHLDYHQTMDNYFQAKAKLFKTLRSDSFSVINIDNSYGRAMQRLTNARQVTYAIDNQAQVMAEDIKFDLANTEFKVKTQGRKINLKTKLIGRHNVYNTLGCVAWSLAQGIAPELIKKALENFSGVPGRLERVDSGGKFSVFVDYAHTDDALKCVITALRLLVPKRIIVVFGCGGERDKTKRPKMGEVVSRLADYAVITSDNPRSESPEAIIEDIQSGLRTQNYRVVSDRKLAIREALSLAKSNDIVLIAGKGHEHYQIFKDKIIHFDDREVAKECLRQMNC